MKLVIAGATGLLGSELVRQSLRMPTVSSVIALGRRAVSAPDGADAAKLKSVIVEDFGSYPEDVRREFEGAGACIWTIAITPSKAKAISTDIVTRVCQTYAVDGLRALSESSPARPFRYLYVSGMLAERDQTKRPAFSPEYCLMRGQTESMVLKIGEESKGSVEVGVTKPGFIIKPGLSLASFAAAVGQAISVLDSVGLQECAAAMLDQAVNGFEKETMENGDLRRIGEKVLAEQKQ